MDGGAEFVGSDAGRAAKEIARAAKEPKAALDAAEVLLAVVEDGLSSEVGRGENAGRNLAHAAVVRRLDVLGPLASGEPFDRRLDVVLDPSWRRDRLRAVAFVQEVASRRILGAAQVRL